MEVFKIGICDDEDCWHDHAKNIIEQYVAEAECQAEMVFFHGKAEMLAYEGTPLDAVFMDIELEEDNGIEVASLINEKWQDCAIVYVTNYLFYATEAYQTEHIYFVLKEQFDKKIGTIFNKLSRNREQIKNRLVFEVIGGVSREVSVSPKDILYFERDKRRTLIHTVWGTYEIWDKISEIEEKLPKLDFARCHNSYIVYLPAIREFSLSGIIMRDGEQIPVSRKFSPHVKAVFTRWAATEIV